MARPITKPKIPCGKTAGKWRRDGLKKLSEKHELFCLEFVANGLRNQADAYIKAGFSRDGARQSASLLRRDPLVSARIAELLADRFKQLHMSADEILARAAMIARADVRGLYDEHGNLRNPADMDLEDSAAIAGIEVVEEFSGTGKDRVKVGETKKVRLRDPMPAIRLLAEHKKLVKVPDGGGNDLVNALADRLLKARARKRKE